MRLVVLALLVLAVPARANVGQRVLPGVRATEPTGLRAIAIEREDLRFDLRPTAERDESTVSAVYQLDNRGDTVTAPLVFVDGAVSTNTRVTFDGAAVPGEQLIPSQVEVLPRAWAGPLTTPAIDGGAALDYSVEGTGAYAFTLVIPPGKHQLAVTYEAYGSRAKSREGGTLLHQLGYVLAPARDWGAFGTLDVTVLVPAGWRTATSPALARTGDTLHGTFSSLPDDTIGITFQAPTTLLHAILQYVLPLLALLVVLGGGYLMRAVGRRRGRGIRPLWPATLPAAMGWGLAIAISVGLAGVRSTLGLPAGQVGAYGYVGLGAILAGILGGLVAIPVGMMIARAAAPRLPVETV